MQSPLKILVVDDVSTNRVFLARAIRRMLPTAEVHEAADGLEAAQMVERDIPFYDVICMDKEMPVLDGYDATLRLRERGFRGQIIGVTANALTEDVQRFMACGLDTVVTKPVDVKELLRKVQRFSGRHFSVD
jgi:CheY-like chemotaxis protein